MAKKFLDLAGLKFGKLIAVWPVGRDKHRAVIWLCVCDCGSISYVRIRCLTTGATQSCGCYSRDVHSRLFRQHGATVGRIQTPEYRSYHHAKNRCTNPNNDGYYGYGGIGTEFRFANFEEFIAEVGTRPTPHHSIDRKDPFGHYEKGNVKWATPKEQANNRRNSRRETSCLSA